MPSIIVYVILRRVRIWKKLRLKNKRQDLALDQRILSCDRPAMEYASGASLKSIERPELVPMNGVEHKAKESHSGDTALPTNLRGEDLSLPCGTVCQFCEPQDEADAATQLIARNKLLFAIQICVIFMGVEIVSGILSNSLAILTDAAHLFLDVAGFSISLFAIRAGGWKPTPRHSYGFYRLEILGAFFSIQIIWLLTGVLVYKAINRLLHYSMPVNGKIMFFTASVGVLVNISMMLILGHKHGHGHKHDHNHGPDCDESELEEFLEHNHRKDHNEHIIEEYRADEHEGEHEAHHACCKASLLKSDQYRQVFSSGDGSPSQSKLVGASLINSTCIHIADPANELLCKGIKADKDLNRSDAHLVQNINIQSAYLHVLGDLVQSVGVMVAGGLIWYKPSWRGVDLGCTLLFSVLVLGTTVHILRDIIEVLMESTPREIDTRKLEQGLCQIPKVVAVHELHVWAITIGRTLLTCHVRIQSDGNADAILHDVVQFCSGKFKISHVTVQIERDLDD